MFKSIGLIFFLSVVLTACGTMQPKPTVEAKPDLPQLDSNYKYSETDSERLLWERQRELAKLTQWNIQGRTVVRDKKEAWNVGLRWQQNKTAFKISLLGPFSQGGVTLEGNDEYARLTMSDGQQLYSENVEDLIAEALGVALPINALRDWVRGMPFKHRSVDAIDYDEQGQITHLDQEGWQVDFKRYIKFNEYTLPSKVFITQPDRSLRLVITAWKDSE